MDKNLSKNMFGNKKYNLGINVKINSMKNNIKGLGMFGDTDKDGRINILDCDPLNPKKQHIRPSMATRERLEKLPVYVTDEEAGSKEIYDMLDEEDEKKRKELEEKKGFYHILSKKAKKKAPEARRRLLSIIKKQPHAIGEIERTKPRAVIYSSKRSPSSEGPAGGRMYADPTCTKGEEHRHTVVLYGGLVTPKEERKGGIVLKKAVKKALIKHGKLSSKEAEKRLDEISTKKYSRQQAERGTIFHELEHVEQVERWHGKKPKPRLAKKMWAREKKWEDRPSEQQAEQVRKKAISKRQRTPYGAKKYATRQFVRTIDEELPRHHRDTDMGLI